MNATFKYGSVARIYDRVQKQIDMLSAIKDEQENLPETSDHLYSAVRKDMKELLKIKGLLKYMITDITNQDDWEITLSVNDFEIMNRAPYAYK
jgi:hypothetical protein